MNPRVLNAIKAKNDLLNDFFGGWLEDDIKLFVKYHCEVASDPYTITDFFGFRTPSNLVPWASHLSGSIITHEPIPDDGIRAEAIEYYAVLSSIENCAEESYTIVELGASYAPWAAFASTIAKRIGIKKINAVAVEASDYFIKEIYNIFKANDLYGDLYISSDVSFNLKVINGAVSNQPGVLYFPKVDSFDQNGGQASNSKLSIDYVGRSIEHVPVNGYTLEMILSDLSFVDIIHCDIQGAELDVLLSSIDVLKSKVKYIFIGTHSRYIEGVLFKELHSNGFELLRERPCVFHYTNNLQEMSGMTVRDGGQFWINKSKY